MTDTNVGTIEEDIEALRDYLDSGDQYDDYHFSHGYGKNLENLLTRYKELEEEKARYEHKYEIAFNKLIEYEKTLEKLQKETIWKSLIKEKIEKIEKVKNLAEELIEKRIVIIDSDSLHSGQRMAHDYDITILQELLRRGRGRVSGKKIKK